MSFIMASRIPSHLMKELHRHVKNPSVKPSSSNSSQKDETTRKYSTLFGAVTFLAITSSIPFFVIKWIGPLNERDSPLTASQIRRGAFNNSGSKDVGKDPMWDFSTGTRIKDEAYKQLFLKDDPSKVDHGDVFVASSRKT